MVARRLFPHFYKRRMWSARLVDVMQVSGGASEPVVQADRLVLAQRTWCISLPESAALHLLNPKNGALRPEKAHSCVLLWGY